MIHRLDEIILLFVSLLHLPVNQNHSVHLCVQTSFDVRSKSIVINLCGEEKIKSAKLGMQFG